MSQAIPLPIESFESYTNRAGFSVPTDKQAHLSWWFHQIPLMEVATPEAPTMATYQQCCIKEAQTYPVPDTVRDNFCLKVLEKRLTSLGMIATPWMIVFLASLCKSPAEAVMWAFFMKIQSITTKSNLLSMQDIGIVFPKGLPTSTGMAWMWDLQKLGEVKSPAPDNLLDYIRMGPSET